MYGDGPRKTIITGRKNFNEGVQPLELQHSNGWLPNTLYVQTHRQFYHNCVISGTVDFIFGDAAAVVQNSLIIVRKPEKNQNNAVTAQGRVNKHETTGIVLQNCRIVPEQKFFSERLLTPTYLGKPLKKYSRTVIMESIIDDLIQPAGWLEWDNGDFGLNTVYFAEYANKGPGAVTDQRVKWNGFKVITDRMKALQFTPEDERMAVIN
ncbi:hypothetical protein F8388_014980 [Cannabis sativa]|uniref:Pectinesterase n=1 Tax=Cannabis sativa TaxID=3483 RepID=A0A7J6DYH4_CANSA|nr:hypothetical protein F8388_014980 [Cannabis sativa]